jgi:fibronectin type 3 domain-containing protein
MRNNFERFTLGISFVLAFMLQANAAVPTPPENIRPSWIWTPVPLVNEVLLTWDVVPDATAYNVYLWDDSAQAWGVVVTGLTEPRYRDAVNPTLPARYVVTAVNADGESAASLEAIVYDGNFDNYIMVVWPGYYPNSLTATSAWVSWYISAVSGGEGMVDISLNGTDYTTVYHQPNYQFGHGLWVTNLTPLTVYWYRLTTISTNRVGYAYTNYFVTEDTNHPPVADSLDLSTYMGYPVNVELHGTDNASWVPDYIETFRIIQGPTNGTVSATILPAWNNSAGLLYTPAQNRPLADHFWYVANDGELDSAPALVTITNIYYNRLPEGAYTNYTTTVGVAIPIELAGYDPDGDPVVFELDPSYTSTGEVTGPLTNLLYTPPPGFAGQDYVLYKVSDDGMVTWLTGMIVIDVLSTNIAPVAFNQNVTLSEDNPQTIVLTAQDANGDLLTYSIIASPGHGSLSGTGSLLSYTPAANYNGPDSFTFRVNDGQADSATATVSLTITAVNDAPVAYPNTVTTWEDTSVGFTLQATDVEGNALTYAVLPPTNGVLSGSGAVRNFNPTPNWSGTDILRFRVNDGFAWSELVTVTIVVTPVNDIPQFVPQTFTIPEDTTAAFVPTVTDPDGDAYTISLLSAPTNGWLETTVSGYVYHPNTNATGADRVVFSVTETNMPQGYQGVQVGPPATVIGVININVTPVNDAPVANSQSVTTAEDTAKSITLSGFDPDNFVLAYSLLSSPAHGTLTGLAPNLNYMPSANYHGPDSFTFRIFDGSQYSAAATVSITVSSVNDRPTASSANYTVPEDGVIIFGTSGNDLDGDALTHVITVPPAHGSLEPYGTSGSSWTYRPALNYNGADSFVFVVNDGTTNSGAATVSFTITALNDMPGVTNQSVTTAEDTALNITPLAGDVDGDPLTFTLFTGPGHGSVTVNGGQLIYTPAANYNGPDSFEYQAHDPSGGVNTALVSVTVTPVADAPVANAQSVTVNEDAGSAMTLTGSDVDGGTLTMTVVTPPSHGSLSGTPPNLTYLAAANYNGPDSFTFKISDGTLESAPATVSITVTAVNDAPAATSQNLSTAEDTSLNVTLSGTDVDGDALSYVIVANPAHGSLSGTAPDFVYTPAANYNGADSFTFRANDGLVSSVNGTISIAVTPVNDAPVANGQSLSTPYNTALALTLTGSDIEGGSLIYSVLTSPANGVLSGTAPNLTFTPNIGYNGDTSFTFRVNDGNLNSASATISITVQAATAVPAAPSGLTAVAVSSSQINLAWTDNSANEDGFKIERSLNASAWTEIGTVARNVTSYASTGLSANKTYYYRVRAYNMLGNSAYSANASAKTLK